MKLKCHSGMPRCSRVLLLSFQRYSERRSRCFFVKAEKILLSVSLWIDWSKTSRPFSVRLTSTLDLPVPLCSSRARPSPSGRASR